MSMRHLVLGLAAAAALGAAALSSTSAAAQGWRDHPHAGSGRGWSDFRDHRWDRGGWGHGRDRWGGDGWGRHHRGPDCHVRRVRYWDGWGWVVERRRVCR